MRTMIGWVRRMGSAGVFGLVLQACLSNPTPHPGRPDAGRGDDLGELGPTANDDLDGRSEGAGGQDCEVEVHDALSEVLGGCGEVGPDAGDAVGGDGSDAPDSEMMD